LEALTESWEHPTPMLETSMVRTWDALSETQERPPPMSETSMAAPLGGIDGDTGVPTTYIGDVDGGPLGRRCLRPGTAHHLCRRCRWWPPCEVLTETWEHPPPMSEMSMVGPLGGADGDPGAPPPISETSMADPLGGTDGAPRAPTSYLEDVDVGPPGMH
jgi:hypothetical protein